MRNQHAAIAMITHNNLLLMKAMKKEKPFLNFFVHLVSKYSRNTCRFQCLTSMHQLKLKFGKFNNDTVCGKNTCFSMGGHHPPK